MFWQCEHCGAINDILTLKGPEVQSLLNPKKFKAVCEHCGESTARPVEMKEPLTLLDTVERLLGDEPSASHLISEENTVEVIDTPRVWGESFEDVGGMVKVDKAPALLVSRMSDVMSKGRSVIDIVSLDAPGEGDEFEQAIFSALKAATIITSGEVVIRILFGFVPVQGRFNTWCGRLLKEIRKWGGYTTPKLFIGQLYSVKETQWNHCKIMASDGVRAVVGGHNLWWSAYATLPMAHDISLYVVGRAAHDAQAYCEYMWNWGGKWLNAWTLKPGKCLETDWVTVETRKGDKPVRIFCCFPSKEDKGIGSDLVFPPDIKVPSLVSKVKLGAPGLVLLEEPAPYPARIMGLGRCAQSHLPASSSDIAKEVIIKNAKYSLKLCQQDIVFLGSGLAFPFAEKDHLVCKWIAEALLASEKLDVKIVVSPQRAWGGGAQYSWTSGATGTMKLLQKFLKAFAGNKEQYKSACLRLEVAPFCFTSCEFDSEDASKVEPDKLYRWPTLGKVGQPYPIGFSVYPAPANHAKFYVGDNQVCYVGSDNLYPNSNAEFGFLVEGRAVQELLESYWNHVWLYSNPHCIKPTEDWE